MTKDKTTKEKEEGRVRLKKNCLGCKAVDSSQGVSKCDLGYPHKDYYVPKVPCPKPRTNKAFVNCINENGFYRDKRKS